MPPSRRLRFLLPVLLAPALAALSGSGSIYLEWAWTAAGDQPDVEFGSSFSSAGDVNGDGYSDVVIGSPTYSGTLYREGRIDLILGGPSGLQATAAWSAWGGLLNRHLGRHVSTAGDVNGDGFDDIVAASISGTFVYCGSEGGTMSAFSASPIDGGSSFDVAPAGDIDRDGRDDVILATNQGITILLARQDSFLPLAPLVGPHGALAGIPIVGDFNGDGFIDVAGASKATGGYQDWAAVWFGSEGGIDPACDWTQGSHLPDDSYGWAVAAGDFNGDGHDDLLVGAPATYSTSIDLHLRRGRVYVYHGGPAGLPLTATSVFTNPTPMSWFGSSLATADVNGDGFADAVVGAPLDDAGNDDEGGTFAFRGAASGLGSEPAWSDWGGSQGSQFGKWVAGAGDVNGDGFDDVVISSPYLVMPETGAMGALYGYHGRGAATSQVSQWRLDGKGEIVPGGTVIQSGFVASAVISSPEEASLQLEVEARPVGTAFTGHDTVVSDAVPSGGQASVALTGLERGKAYHWQLRPLVAGTRVPCGKWRPFGPPVDDLNTSDVFIRTNRLPILSSLQQRRTGSAEPLVEGGKVYDYAVHFTAVAVDDDGDEIRLEIDATRVGAALTDGPDLISPMASGGDMTPIPGRFEGGLYRWRVRARDETGEATEWKSFGINDEEAADFEVVSGSFSGTAACLQGAEGRGFGVALALLLIIIAASRRRA